MKSTERLFRSRKGSELVDEMMIVIQQVAMIKQVIVKVAVTQCIPTMTKSHHGGEMSVMIKVGNVSEKIPPYMKNIIGSIYVSKYPI